MASRQQRIDTGLDHLGQVQNSYPDTDLSDMSRGMENNINFEFDVKEILGTETWQHMNNSLQKAFSSQTKPDVQAALAEVRNHLNGHKDLEAKFDIIYNRVDHETIALANKISTKLD